MGLCLEAHKKAYTFTYLKHLENCRSYLSQSLLRNQITFIKFFRRLHLDTSMNLQTYTHISGCAPDQQITRVPISRKISSTSTILQRS